MAKKEASRGSEGLMEENGGEQPLVTPQARIPKSVEIPQHNSVTRMGADAVGAAEGAAVLRMDANFKTSKHESTTEEKGSKEKNDIDLYK